MPSLQARVLAAADVTHRELGEEMVAVNLRTGQYHSLNPSAGRMLDELLAGPTVGAALARIEAIYNAPRETLERDLLALCDALAERGLVSFDEHG